MKPLSLLRATFLATLPLAGISHAVPTIAGGNGSFETVTTGTAAFGGAYGQIWYLNPTTENTSGADISGWTLYAPGGTLPANASTAWLMGDNTYGAPSDGTYQVNVEAGPDWWLRASLENLTIGGTYTVSFQARRRQSNSSGTFDVFVDTATPTQLSPSPASTSWVPQSLTFVAEAATHTLTISNTDNPGNNGFMVDQFSIAEETWTAGDGIWTGGNGDWNTATNWQSNTIAQGIDQSATFNGLTPVTATVDVNRPIGALIFSGANHTLAAGSGSLTLDGDTIFATPTVTVASAITATIAATLNGSEGLLKDGAGTLVLSGNNSYSGGTTVSVGTLKLDLGLKSGNPPLGSFAVESGATLNLDNTNTTVGSYYPQSFVLSGEGTLTKTNTGSIDFWSNSDLTGFTGILDVQQGAIRLNNLSTGKAYMPQATLNITGGALVDLRYSNATGNDLTITVDKLTGTGTIDHTYPQTGTYDVTVGANNGSSQFDGVIQNTNTTGVISLTKEGGGTFTLAGINSYSGNTTINDGTLVIADDAQLKFVVSDATSNTISGTGIASIKGDFSIDTTAVTGTTGGIWTLVNFTSLAPASAIDPATFTVIGFVDPENDGIWTMTDAKGDWSFSETTGELTLDIGTDYDTWKSANGVTGGPGADDDSDGLTNFEEYAFGLDPTGGSSINPIALPLDKTAKTFSYTRRAASLPDPVLDYTVWFSSDLITWTKDTSASQSVTGTVGEVETVEVTISTLPGEPLPAKLFIQVRAEQP